MALQGTLKEMTVADLIQHNCLDYKTARLRIDHNGQSAFLFFKDGRISHAAMDNSQGEEVVFQILNWRDGQFTLEMGFESPTESISRSWSGLLLEGARRLDEASEQTNDSPGPQPVAYPDSPFQNRLSEIFERLSDIEGVAVIGVDGEVLAARLPQAALGQDEVGAIGAALLGLSKRSVDQLKRSNFKQAFLQGTQGNIIITNITDEILFVGLTPNDVNMGFVLAEAREITAKVRDVLSNY